MARRYQNGLVHTYASTNVGKFFHRWLFEWLTQVVGWTMVDKAVGTVWDNVVASGSTCSSTTASRISITSGGYAFSSTDIGSFLTLTGFSVPERNGIYRISGYVGSVGSVYTVELEIERGTHSDGIPIGDSGISWRLWRGTDAYCPTTNDVAVVAGTGTTGAGLTNGAGTGDSFGQSGSTTTLTDAGANFQASDVGKKITIAGATTGGNNGTFTIATRVSATQITYTNASGATEAFSGTWTIRYPYHVHMQVGTTFNGFGSLRVSPFASWSSGTHNWVDSRYTAQITPSSPGGNPINVNGITIYAVADSDFFFVALLGYNSSGGYAYWTLYAIGEMDTFYPDTDPNPCWGWSGCDAGTPRYDYTSYTTPIIGQYYDGSNYGFPLGIKGLGYDNLTSLTYLAAMPVCFASADFNVLFGTRRKLSMRSRRFYKLPILLESRTTGFIEMRGTMRNINYVSTAIPLFYQQGTAGESMVMLRGVLVPWNGARNANPYVGMQQGPG